ncbi:MAG: hypothetical protein H0X37_18235 [Herpetosiphonaceae bacterium]|nr:hypothetical protein [Herpetosiphonaceae bacterium]
MNINLHIDRLVLDGIELAPGQRLLLQAAVEAELGRLLTEGGIAPTLQTGGTLPRVSGGTMQMTNPNNPQSLGQEIARSVYGGLGT